MPPYATSCKTAAHPRSCVCAVPPLVLGACPCARPCRRRRAATRRRRADRLAPRPRVERHRPSEPAPPAARTTASGRRLRDRRPRRCSTAGHADDRHRLAGLRAVVRRQRPDQRQGLRVGRRLRGRRRARLHRRPGHLGDGAVQHLLQAGRQDLRLRHQPDLDHARRAPRSSTSPTATTPPRRPSSRSRAPPGAEATSLADLKRPAPGRADRHHLAHRDPRRDPARHRPAGLRGHQHRQAGAEERPGRRDPGRPADRVLHQRRRDRAAPRSSASSRSRASRPSSSGCSSRRAPRSSPASTRRSPTLEADGTLADLEQQWLSDVVDVPDAPVTTYTGERAGPPARASSSARRCAGGCGCARSLIASRRDRRRPRRCWSLGLVTSPGWPTVQETFFSVEDARAVAARRSRDGFVAQRQALPARRAADPRPRPRARARRPGPRRRG